MVQQNIPKVRKGVQKLESKIDFHWKATDGCFCRLAYFHYFRGFFQNISKLCVKRGITFFMAVISKLKNRSSITSIFPQKQESFSKYNIKLIKTVFEIEKFNRKYIAQYYWPCYKWNNLEKVFVILFSCNPLSPTWVYENPQMYWT